MINMYYHEPIANDNSTNRHIKKQDGVIFCCANDARGYFFSLSMAIDSRVVLVHENLTKRVSESNDKREFKKKLSTVLGVGGKYLDIYNLKNPTK